MDTTSNHGPNHWPNHWIALASAEHVKRGRAGGFMQVCHGKDGPLRRMRAGDGVAYYSPSITMGRTDGFQSFTAVGHIADSAPYLYDMGGGFVPWRRDVMWDAGDTAPIRPLLQALEFTRGKQNWGYAFRFGVLKVSEADFLTITDAMRGGTSQAPVSAGFALAGL